MGLFDLFRKKSNNTESTTPAASNSIPAEEVVKITIPTPKPTEAISYEGEIDNIRAFFGKLYKNNVKGTEDRYNFNILHVEIPVGVYYGYTKYTGETNRNGVKAVAFHLPDDSLLVELDRKQWRQYEKEATTDGLKWLGYSDGESVRLTVYKDKVLEGYVTSFLSNVGEWINAVAFRNSILKRVEKMNLPEGEFTYSKADSGFGYDYYYNGRYVIAGIERYVTSPFVSFGYAKLEPNNKFNSKAVAIYTDYDKKIGYISEKELSKYYTEINGVDNIPLVVEAHYYNGKLYGWLYTFSKNKEEYHYIVNQFLKLIEE
jgi:hypothetical protein